MAESWNGALVQTYRQKSQYLHKHSSQCLLIQETGDVSPKVPEGEGKRILTEQQELLVIGLLLDAPTLYMS